MLINYIADLNASLLHGLSILIVKGTAITLHTNKKQSLKYILLFKNDLNCIINVFKNIFIYLTIYNQIYISYCIVQNILK